MCKRVNVQGGPETTYDLRVPDDHLWPSITLVMVPPPVASLGLVSPGAATDGVTYFFPPKNDDLFSHRLL